MNIIIAIRAEFSEFSYRILFYTWPDLHTLTISESKLTGEIL